ncbi:MAG: hypothetical protein H8E61_09215 [Bacteroidetes bacterium]|nr:hypothetical protein [Bacteroidota bacterium]
MKRSQTQLLEFLLELNQMAFRYLLEIHSGSSNTTGKLTFPSYSKSHRDGEVRISEQELRFAYTAVLERSGIYQPYYYSVETPTENLFSFSNEKSLGRSAMSDLSLYERNETAKDKKEQYEKVCNIECKALNPHKESIRKDIKKLIIEKETGVWGHLLINQDRETLPELFKKFIYSFNLVLKEAGNKREYLDKAYFFAIGILEKKLLLTRKILPGEICKDLSNIFSINNGKLKIDEPGRQMINNWQVELFTS